jgi:hypothetical protein
MKLSEEDKPNKICLINDNHVVICCNNSTIYSIKFSHFKDSATMAKAQIPGLPLDTDVFDMIHTFKHEHLICTSVGLVRRNLHIDREGGKFIMTNDFLDSQ